MSTAGVDETRLEEFMGQMVGYMTGGAACFGIWLGDELGLYSALAKDPGSADRVAAASWLQPATGPRVARRTGSCRPGRVRRRRRFLLDER